MRDIPEPSNTKRPGEAGEDAPVAFDRSPEQRSKWGSDDIAAFMAREFPQACAYGSYSIVKLEPRRATVRLAITEAHLRPGGTVSGPALMALVDYTAYVLLLAIHGSQARLAVTTGLTISFLRKAGHEDVECEVELLKHGRNLTVADCRIRACADGRLLAHSEATYFMAASA